MFSFLLNKQDAEAVTQNTHNRTMDLRRDTINMLHETEANLQRVAQIKRNTTAIWQQAIKERDDIIEQQQEYIKVLTAEVVAANGLLKDKMAIGSDPARMEQLRQMRSRRQDAEFDRMLREGEIKNDPRKLPKWREETGYRPRPA